MPIFGASKRPKLDGLTRDERENLIAATVQILGLFEQEGELMIGYTGSGTLLSLWLADRHFRMLGRVTGTVNAVGR